MADEPAALAARQLQRVGVLLLRHDAAAGAVGVGQADEAELGAAEEDELLGQPAQVDAQQGGGEEELGGEVAVADGVEAVGRHVAKAEASRQRRPVEREGRPGQRRRAQRQHGRRPSRRGEACSVAGQRPEVAQRPVAPGDRLGVLQVGVAGQGQVEGGGGAVGQGALHVANGLIQPVAGAHDPQPEVGRHLVVAAAAGVELAADRAGDLRQPPLDGRVDVLVIRRDGERAGGELGPHCLQPGQQRVALLGRQ